MSEILDVTLYNNISIKVYLAQHTSVSVSQPPQVERQSAGRRTAVICCWICFNSHSQCRQRHHKLLCILFFSYSLFNCLVLQMFSHKFNYVGVGFFLSLLVYRVCLWEIILFLKSTPEHLCPWSTCRNSTSPRIICQLSPRTCPPHWLSWGSMRTASRRCRQEPSQDWAAWTA